MAITVTGSTLSVTLSNATDLELGGHLTWTADNTKDIGASGANRPRTGYFATSVVTPALTAATAVTTPSVTNAGTLALSATGANIITAATNGVTRITVSSAGAVTIAGDTLILATSKTPASAAASGTTGHIAWDADYIYIATASNTWKRVAIATW